MHAALVWVLPDNSIDHDDFLPSTAISNPYSSELGESIAYRSVNHPFLPLSLLEVCVGLGGMRMNEAMPNISVSNPYVFVISNGI